MKAKITAICLFVSITFGSCVSLYDHFTLTETVATKVQMENLLDNATTPYTDNLAAINALKTQMQKMLVYERTKDKNVVTTKMWELMTGENSTINSFLETWESQGTMSAPFVEEFRPQITEMFDLMIDFESKKDKQAENALLQIIASVAN